MNPHPARRDSAWLGVGAAWHGLARLPWSWLVSARHSMVGLGESGYGFPSLGTARPGQAWRGKASLSLLLLASSGMARPGRSRRVPTRPGSARPDMAGPGSPLARLGKTWLGRGLVRRDLAGLPL